MAPDYTVNLVLADTPADGKLEPGDQIVAVNDRSVEEGTLQNLKKLLAVRPGIWAWLSSDLTRLVPCCRSTSPTYACAFNAQLK